MHTNLKAYCNNCKRKTNHESLKEVEVKTDDSLMEMFFYDKWEIIQCLGCETKSFRHEFSNSGDVDYETGETYETVRLYPIRSDSSVGVKPFYNVPIPIRAIYRETLDAYNNGLNILCAAGLRAVIESICAYEKISSGTVTKQLPDGTTKQSKSKQLDGKINGLHEQGCITEKQKISIHENRFLGNEALHTQQAPDQKTLKIGIEIIENILEGMYEMDTKVGQLMYRRQLKNKILKKK